MSFEKIREEIVLDYSNGAKFRESTTTSLKKLEIQNAILLNKIKDSEKQCSRLQNSNLLLIGFSCCILVLTVVYISIY